MAVTGKVETSMASHEDPDPIISGSSRKRKRTTAAPTTPRKSTKKVPTVDLTSEPSPRKNKGKGSPAKSQTEEQRLKRFRTHAPGGFNARLERAVSQRMFVIDRTPGGSVECPEEHVSMAGSTGNIYHVHICQLPSCTCPDARKGNLCKHIIYVEHNVLKAPENLQYQRALLSSELQEIFAGAPSPIASAKPSDGEEDANGVTRRPMEGDCPICFTPFEPDSEEIVYCKAACGNNIHHDCFEQWAKSQTGKEVRCVYCRSPWQGDEEQVMRIIRNKIQAGEEGFDVEGGGYLNVGSELGLSDRRDVSSYHPFWVRSQFRQGYSF